MEGGRGLDIIHYTHAGLAGWLPDLLGNVKNYNIKGQLNYSFHRNVWTWKISNLKIFPQRVN